MRNDQFWTVLAVAVIVVMTFAALSDFAVSGWMIIPAAGLTLYLLISSAVTRGVENAKHSNRGK